LDNASMRCAVSNHTTDSARAERQLTTEIVDRECGHAPFKFHASSGARRIAGRENENPHTVSQSMSSKLSTSDVLEPALTSSR
jgi:hypothetical protein